MGTTGFFPGARFSDDLSEVSAKHRFLESTFCQDDSVHVDDDVTSTMSESSSGIGGLVSSKATERQISGRKAIYGHESDVDSGIVSCQLMDSHSASISSSETESSRESSTNDQKSKGVSDSNQYVRFDEQLHLSEENIRRSCRKLFATLYSHRFSYPCYDNGILNKASQVQQHAVPLLDQNAKEGGSGAQRFDRTGRYAKLDTTRTSNVDHESYRHRHRLNRPMENSQIFSTFGAGDNKENGICKSVQKGRPPYWRSESDIVHSTLKLFPDIKHNTPVTKSTLLNGALMESEVPVYRTRTASSAKEQRNHRRLSVDHHVIPVSINGIGRQKHSFAIPSFPASHQQQSYSSFLNAKSRQSPIHKSLSCTVLSSTDTFGSTFAHYSQKEPSSPRRTSDPISVSSLNICDNYRVFGDSSALHQIPQAAVRDGMVRAYARVVPVVSDDSNSYKETPAPKLPDKSANGDLKSQYLSNSEPSSGLSAHSKNRNLKPTSPSTRSGFEVEKSVATAQKSISYKDLNSHKRSDEFLGNSRSEKGRSSVGGRRSGVVHSQPDFSDIRYHEYANKNTASYKGFPTASKEIVSPQKSSTLSRLMTNGTRKSTSKAEFETLDQNKKNRFNSLPVLDDMSTVNKDGHLPLNIKRGLHQSDFTLYRNRFSPSSSSSGKSLLDRLQGFTRSAKNAVQRAFSTERIYRPEREERYESEEQKLKRSHSFIRGLKERMSKKKKRREKKNKKPTAAQVVTQERLNTSWDEPVIGPGSVNHVQGQLLQLNPDGSQVIELTKPPSKPYGFFVARGRIRNSRGVFVSRMRDQDTEEHLTGLLGIGDEILEIEGLNVKHAEILEVNSMMAQRNSLILTVLPYVCRKD